MTVLVYPRDPNPYQHLLHGALAELGVEARFLVGPTRSHTLNLAVLPAQLVRARRRGARVVHLHWVFPFGVPGLPPWLARRAATVLFAVFLWTVRATRLRLVWTAHNVLPHAPVFTDDTRGRRRLVDAADAVIVHSDATLRALSALGVTPRRAYVAPHGPYPTLAVEPPADRPAEPVVLFFGRVAPYKGVLDLLLIWRSVRDAVPGARLVIAGECPDAGHRRELEQAVTPGVELRLAPVPDAELPALFAAADLVCLPFRSVTTSGSALLATGFRKPLLVPALEQLSDLLGPGILRYGPEPAGLGPALVGALRRGRPALAALGAAAPAPDASLWHDAATVHAHVYRTVQA